MENLPQKHPGWQPHPGVNLDVAVGRQGDFEYISIQEPQNPDAYLKSDEAVYVEDNR